MFSTKIAIFLVGIISVVSLFACQKPALINQMYQILRKHKKPFLKWK